MHHPTLRALALCSAVGLAVTAAYAGPKLPHGLRLPARTILAFHTMYGVDGPFTDEKNAIRGIPGDEDPWEIDKAIGSLDTKGHLRILVRGLVFKDNDDPTLIGHNDADEFKGVVSCLTEENGEVTEKHVETEGFPADFDGNSFIHGNVELPNPCVAPIVFIIPGDEFKWFAATGFENEED